MCENERGAAALTGKITASRQRGMQEMGCVLFFVFLHVFGRPHLPERKQLVIKSGFHCVPFSLCCIVASQLKLSYVAKGRCAVIRNDFPCMWRLVILGAKVLPCTHVNVSAWTIGEGIDWSDVFGFQIFHEKTPRMVWSQVHIDAVGTCLVFNW